MLYESDMAAFLHIRCAAFVHGSALHTHAILTLPYVSTAFSVYAKSVWHILCNAIMMQHASSHISYTTFLHDNAIHTHTLLTLPYVSATL